MRQVTCALLACVCVAALVVCGCSSSSYLTPTHTGFLSDYSKLKPSPNVEGAFAWRAPGFEIKNYNKFMIDEVTIYLDKDSAERGFKASELKELTDYFHESVIKALGDQYPIVTEPGPGVLEIRAAITHLKGTRPIKTIVTIVPQLKALSVLKRGVTGTQIGVGQAGIEVEFIDTGKGQVVAQFIDRRAGGVKLTEVGDITEWSQVKQIFDDWAKDLRKRLDAETGKTPAK